jgi:hypothetical protein
VASAARLSSWFAGFADGANIGAGGVFFRTRETNHDARTPSKKAAIKSPRVGCGIFEKITDLRGEKNISRVWSCGNLPHSQVMKLR